MRKNLIKSIISGSILGIAIGLSSINTSIVGLIFSLFLCALFGLFTVLQFTNKANLYSLVVTVTSSFYICFSYGINDGLIYTAGVAVVYGIISVQLIQAGINASDNLKYLVSKLLNKE